MKHFLAVLFVALMFTPAAHAVKAIEVESIRDEMILDPLSSDAEKKTHDALVKSAHQLGWEVVQDTPPVMQLRLQVRKHTIVVNVTVKGNKVDIDYVDSANMRYRKLNDGRAYIHPGYTRWLANLLKTARAIAVSPE